MIAAHIAGIPVEETALSAGPVIVTIGGIALVRLREGMGRAKAGFKRGDETKGAVDDDVDAN